MGTLNTSFVFADEHAQRVIESDTFLLDVKRKGQKYSDIVSLEDEPHSLMWTEYGEWDEIKDDPVIMVLSEGAEESFYSALVQKLGPPAQAFEQLLTDLFNDDIVSATDKSSIAICSPKFWS